MNTTEINQILQETAYIRTAGSKDEHRCGEYLRGRCADLGLQTTAEPFALNMATIHEAVLTVDGQEIPCKGYLRGGCGEVEAEIYYLTNTDPGSISCCKGKIVLFDGVMRSWIYKDLLAAGAVGFISYDGNVFYDDCDIDQKEIWDHIYTEDRIPGVHIHAKSAVSLVRSGAKTAKIRLRQDEYVGESRNIILELPGETDEWIVLTAHYDSTSLSIGAYDNMTGCIALLSLAEKFAKEPHRRGLRFIWCGAEERGLKGSRAYCAAHEEALKNVVMNVNLDMIGSLMGKFVARCTAEEKLVHYVQYFAAEHGKGIDVSQSISSSDSASFSDKGVPSVSFCRFAPPNTASFHNRYDTALLVSPDRLADDISFVACFLHRMVNAVYFPVAREIPGNMKEKLDYYFFRKRDPATM